jgi:site-specific recombinase XerD
MLLSSALDDFLDAKTMRLNDTSQRWYAHKLTVFLKFCTEQDISDTGQLTPAIVRAFLRHLRQQRNSKSQPLASKTLHCYLKVLSTFLHWLVHEGIIPERVAGIEFPTLERKVVQTFTEYQIAALLKACQGCAYRWQVARDTA